MLNKRESPMVILLSSLVVYFYLLIWKTCYLDSCSSPIARWPLGTRGLFKRDHFPFVSHYHVFPLGILRWTCWKRSYSTVKTTALTKCNVLFIWAWNIFLSFSRAEYIDIGETSWLIAVPSQSQITALSWLQAHLDTTLFMVCVLLVEHQDPSLALFFIVCPYFLR